MQIIILANVDCYHNQALQDTRDTHYMFQASQHP